MSDTEQELISEQNHAAEQDSDHKHEHYQHHRHKSKVKPFVYSVLAFFLAFALFLFSVCMVLQFTVFSKEYMINIMRSGGYHDMVKAELQSRMEDLGDSSGFDKEFSQNFANSYDVQKAVEDYITSFYSGGNTLVETTSFKQQLYNAVDLYVREKNITLSSDAQTNITYFVNEAADIYIAQISIPFFSTIANYIFKAKTVLNTITICLCIFALIIIAIIFFTNQYKHRRFRYLFIGSSAAAITIFILPTVVLMSNKIRQINLETRSIYSLFVNYFNTLFMNFYIWFGVLTVISVIMIILYVRHYRRVSN